MLFVLIAAVGRSDPLRGHRNKAELTDSKLISGDKTSQVEVSTTMICEFHCSLKLDKTAKNSSTCLRPSSSRRLARHTREFLRNKKKKKFRTLLGHKSSFFISMVTL